MYLHSHLTCDRLSHSCMWVLFLPHGAFRKGNLPLSAHRLTYTTDRSKLLGHTAIGRGFISGLNARQYAAAEPAATTSIDAIAARTIGVRRTVRDDTGSARARSQKGTRRTCAVDNVLHFRICTSVRSRSRSRTVFRIRDRSCRANQ